MSLTDGNGGLSAADVAAVMGNNANGFGFGGDGAWWFILLILLFAGNGWGNGYGNAGTGAEVQRGFDQSAVMNGINGITATLNANQNSTIAGMNSLAMSLQNCCCENRAATADLKYTIANESAATRAANQAGTQSILDKLCQLEMDNMKQNYENRISGMQNQIDNLRASLNAANGAASQNAQTAAILADNAAQTVALDRLILYRILIAAQQTTAIVVSERGASWQNTAHSPRRLLILANP